MCVRKIFLDFIEVVSSLNAIFFVSKKTAISYLVIVMKGFKVADGPISNELQG